MWMPNLLQQSSLAPPRPSSHLAALAAGALRGQREGHVASPARRGIAAVHRAGHGRSRRAAAPQRQQWKGVENDVVETVR